MLVTLVGKDKSGIIAAITEKLGMYNINIEVSDVVARENIFLMDLLCDVSKSALPTENLKAAIREAMLSIRINTMFQTEDVFNKKKKIVMFDMAHSFMEAAFMREIMKHAGIKPEALDKTTPEQTDLAYMHATAGLLEGLPLSVIDTVMNTIEITRGTLELLQTLKIMGYKIGLITNGFSFFTNAIKSRIGIDYAYGFELPVDDDTQAIVGDLPVGLMQPLDRPKIIADIMSGRAHRGGGHHHNLGHGHGLSHNTGHPPGLQHEGAPRSGEPARAEQGIAHRPASKLRVPQALIGKAFVRGKP